MLASCSGDKTIRVWAPPTAASATGAWECVAILEDAQNRTIRACEWSPDGRFLASVSFDATTVVWEKQGNSYEVVSSLEGHESEVKSVAWSPSGAYIATCSRDKSVWIWEADPDTDFECISVLHGHTQDVKFVTWHPTEDVLISASYDDTVRVWAENDDDWYCKETLTGHTSTVWEVATDPSGERFASVSDDKCVIIWRRDATRHDVRADGSPIEWKQAATLAGAHERTIFSVDWSPQGNWLVTGAADDALRVFREAADGAFELALQHAAAHASDINCVRWSPRAQHGSLLLASAADDALVRIWRFTAATLKELMNAPSPQELRAEQRWSSFQEQPGAWAAAADERLVALVTRSTASGERFPVGVNWLEVSRAVGRSPVECVKRYALLHQHSRAVGVATEARAHLHENTTATAPSHAGTAAAQPPRGAPDAAHASPQDESASEGVPFSGLSSSEGGGSPRPQSFSGFSTPLASPKLSSLETSDEFGVGGLLGSPGSPPPFAVRNALRQNSGDAGAVSSPFKWEALLSESAYSTPTLRSPVHARHRAAHVHSGRQHFGGEADDGKPETAGFASGMMSPRIIHGTQDHTRPMLDPGYAASIISHAFKGMQVTTSAASSPRMIRTAPSSSEFAFLREDDTKRAASGAAHDASAPAFLASPRAAAVPILASEQQLQAHMLKMSAMSTMSSFHGDNPFSGSLTQSALEDAFLDMAGSRLDASSVLLGSRFSMNASRLRAEPPPALGEKARDRSGPSAS
ncbi:hypothetical protein PybrP1_003736 [[Pythium] brassicae (nom. inval.)]|nr:hypothetical protein PybrP1_003736 [[Pythium] brassicae (nom. inval.)]